MKWRNTYGGFLWLMVSLRSSNIYGANCLAVEKYCVNSMGILRTLWGMLDKTIKFWHYILVWGQRGESDK